MATLTVILHCSYKATQQEQERKRLWSRGILQKVEERLLQKQSMQNEQGLPAREEDIRELSVRDYVPLMRKHRRNFLSFPFLFSFDLQEANPADAFLRASVESDVERPTMPFRIKNSYLVYSVAESEKAIAMLNRLGITESCIAQALNKRRDSRYNIELQPQNILSYEQASYS